MGYLGLAGVGVSAGHQSIFRLPYIRCADTAPPPPPRLIRWFLERSKSEGMVRSVEARMEPRGRSQDYLRRFHQFDGWIVFGMVAWSRYVRYGVTASTNWQSFHMESSAGIKVPAVCIGALVLVDVATSKRSLFRCCRSKAFSHSFSGSLTFSPRARRGRRCRPVRLRQDARLVHSARAAASFRGGI